MIPDEVLAQLPGFDAARSPARLQPLAGGQGRNAVVRIDTSAGRFVWRRRLPPVERPGAAARSELVAHRAAAAAGLAPTVLAAAADASWILMEFVDAQPWDEARLCSPFGVARLGTQLARLHALAAPVSLPAADLSAIARGYVQRIGQRDTRVALELAPLLRRLESLGVGTGGVGERRVLVHGDLMANNLLGEAPFLIDWEYAQAADPAWDLACLLSYYPRLQSSLDALLGCAGLDDPAGRERLQLQQERFDLLNRLWEQAYGARGAS